MTEVYGIATHSNNRQQEKDMSTTSTRQKHSFENSTVMSKLAKASVKLDRVEGNDDKVQILKVRLQAKIKRCVLLSSLYKTRFLISLAINQIIFCLLAFFLLDSAPSMETLLLLMFNFVAISTLLFSSAMSFFILDRMDGLSDQTDELCDDISSFVAEIRDGN